LAGLFLVAGVACFVLASNYFHIWPTNDNPLYQGSLAALVLAAALVMRRTERLKALWPLAYAFFVATMVWLLTTLAGGFGNWALRLLDLTSDTPAGMAVAKVAEAAGTVIIILGLSRLAGWTPASLLLRRGDLKWALVAGSLVIVNFATAMLMVSVTPSTDLGALGQLILWGLVFSAANGFMEELWFRGLFIGRLAPHVGASGAVVLTALVFALMHVSAFYFSPQVIPVFLLNLLTHGLVLGWLIYKTDSLWGAVLYHLAMDLWLFIGPLGAGAGG
jgi:membrane protease YdiL (CAAX protease family)